MITGEQDIPPGERLARLETRVEHIEHRLGELVEDIRELRQDVRALDGKIDRTLLWILGIMMTMWVTLFVAIMVRT